MTGPLLVGWDASPPSRDALALALVLARGCGLALRIVHCYPCHESYPARLGMIDAMVADAQQKLDDLPPEALEAGADTALVFAISAAEGLQYEAERSGAHMVVLGSTHRGALGRVVPGAVVDNLTHGAPCAVAVAPAGYAAGDGAGSLRRIAVAFDGSDESHLAVDEAVRLAQAANAALAIVSVVAPPPAGMPSLAYTYEDLLTADRDYASRQVRELEARLPRGLRVEKRLRDGDPATEIAAACATGVDLLVLGSRGYGTLRRTMLGSVSSRVLRHATCPVVVVPHGVRPGGADEQRRGERPTPAVDGR